MLEISTGHSRIHLTSDWAGKDVLNSDYLSIFSSFFLLQNNRPRKQLGPRIDHVPLTTPQSGREFRACHQEIDAS